MTQQTEAYSIHSGLTDGCHERITRQALQLALPNISPANSITIPESEVWKKIADTWSTDNPLEMCKMACPKGTDFGKLKTQESKKR